MPHSIYAPSSAHRWVECPLSITMAQLYPSESTIASEEGERAHTVLANRFRGVLDPVDASDEMLEGADLTEDHIRVLAGEETVHVEERVNCDLVHDECWGTPDFWVFKVATGELHIWDYKYGRKHVEAVGNWQLICYASGLLEQLALGDEHRRVYLHIVQPRSYHRQGPIRTWPVRGTQLRPYINALANAAATGASDKAKVGAHCDYCPGRHACAALQSAAMDACDVAVHSLPLELTPQALGLELRILERAEEQLKARITGLSEQVLSLIRSGQNIAGYRIETGQGREQWTVTAEEAIKIAQLLEVNIAKPLQVLTPAQSRKAGVPDSIVAMYTERKPGSAKLVPDDGTLTKHIFGATHD